MYGCVFLCFAMFGKSRVAISSTQTDTIYYIYYMDRLPSILYCTEYIALESIGHNDCSFLGNQLRLSVECEKVYIFRIANIIIALKCSLDSKEENNLL
jgi:hypothetical protein